MVPSLKASSEMASGVDPETSQSPKSLITPNGFKKMIHEKKKLTMFDMTILSAIALILCNSFLMIWSVHSHMKTEHEKDIIVPDHVVHEIKRRHSEAHKKHHKKHAPHQKIIKMAPPPMIQLQGIVIDEGGNHISGAAVKIERRNHSEVVYSSGKGQFVFPAARNSHVMVVVSADGYRTEIFHTVTLQQRENEENSSKNITVVDIAPIILPSHNPNKARMLFGGDVAFGRRWIGTNAAHATKKSLVDDNNALILASDPEPGTRRALKSLKPWFDEADFSSVNMESPVLGDLKTPNKLKDTAFFTLPGSLKALKWLGVDHVSLGNNHIYDYQDHGIVSTLENADKLNIARSGAGLNNTAAMVPYRTTLSNTKYSFLSVDTGELVGLARQDRGGAANYRDKDLFSITVAQDRQDHFNTILQLHVGVEFSYFPPPQIEIYMQATADLNLPLVVMNNPHVAQGVGAFKSASGKGRDKTIFLMSLGNLAMDSPRLECMLSILARVDMSEDGTQVDRVRFLPVYLENFAPKPIGGFLASRLIRRLAEFSLDFGGRLYPYNGMGYLNLGHGHDNYVTRTRSVIIDVTVPITGSTVLDLREWQQIDESIILWNNVPSSTRHPITVRSGRDIFGFGDFEDYIVDTHEKRSAGYAIEARWDLGENGHPCKGQAYRGSVCVCSSGSDTDSVITNRNRIRVMGDEQNKPQKDLTLLGYMMGNEAGAITVQAHYHSSIGDKTFGDEIVYTHNGGDFDWTAFVADLHMPPDIKEIKNKKKKKVKEKLPTRINARSLQISMHHSAPKGKKDSLVAFDEIAVISWGKDAVGPNSMLRAPHARDFLKVSGIPGTYKLELKFVRHIPNAASKYFPE